MPGVGSKHSASDSQLATQPAWIGPCVCLHERSNDKQRKIVFVCHSAFLKWGSEIIPFNAIVHYNLSGTGALNNKTNEFIKDLERIILMNQNSHAIDVTRRGYFINIPPSGLLCLLPVGVYLECNISTPN